jgi:hypothetical protein
LIDGPQPTERDPQAEAKDETWKKPLLLMIAFTAIPVLIIAVAYAVHSFS